MARTKKRNDGQPLRKGPKGTATGWLYVYNLRSRHGRDRFYFWGGRKGQPQIRVKDDIIHGKEFQAAYARFLAGEHPYPEQEQAPKRPTLTKHVPTATLHGYRHGSWGWACIEHMKSTAFQKQKNKRAIEGQLRWTWDQPVKSTDPEGRKFGEMPLDRFDTEAIQTLVDRKVKTTELEEIDKRSGRLKTVTRTAGASQANNLIKWIRAVLKTGIRKGVVQVNYAMFVERHPTSGPGFRMWTDEIWDRMAAHYPLGTKPRLVFDLAGYTAQRRGDVTFLGYDNFIPPEPGLPFGSLRVEQEKGNCVAHVPVVDELHASLMAAKERGILGSRFFIRQDEKDEPYTKESLGNNVRKWLNDAKIPKGYSLHGLRKLCVCRLIERGCNPHEVMAVTGHQTLKEVDRYARGYFREKKKPEVYAKWRAGAVKAGVGVSEAA